MMFHIRHPGDNLEVDLSSLIMAIKEETIGYCGRAGSAGGVPRGTAIPTAIGRKIQW